MMHYFMNRVRFSLLIFFLYLCSFFESLYSLAPSSNVFAKPLSEYCRKNVFAKPLSEYYHKNVENHLEIEADIIMLHIGDQSINLEERIESLTVKKNEVSSEFLRDYQWSRLRKFSSFLPFNFEKSSYEDYILSFIDILKQYKENDNDFGLYSMGILEAYKQFNPLLAREHFQYWESREDLVLDMIRVDQMHLIYSMVWWTITCILLDSYLRKSSTIIFDFACSYLFSVYFGVYYSLWTSLNFCVKDIFKEYDYRRDLKRKQKKIFLQHFRNIVNQFYDNIDEIYSIRSDLFIKNQRKILLENNNFNDAEGIIHMKMEIMKELCEVFLDFDNFFDQLFKKKSGKKLDEMSFMEIGQIIEEAIFSDNQCPLGQLLFKIFKIEIEEKSKLYLSLKFPILKQCQKKLINFEKKWSFVQENPFCFKEDLLELQKRISMNIESVRAHEERMDLLMNNDSKTYKQLRQFYSTHFEWLTDLEMANNENRKYIEESFTKLKKDVDILVDSLNIQIQSELLAVSA